MSYPQDPYSNYPDWTSAHDPDAPWNQPDQPCEVCEQPETDCTCPVCPRCKHETEILREGQCPTCHAEDQQYLEHLGVARGLDSERIERERVK